MTLNLLRRRTQPPKACRFRPGIYITSTWQPAAPTVDPGPVQWRPPYADLVIAQVLRRYGDNTADRAARMLQQVATVNTAGTGGAL